MIEVNKLTKWFQDTCAVDDISFSVQKGEVVGFLGPNGAGKTTTLRILTCYILPTSGSAEIAGNDIYNGSTEIRKRIGYLPEESPLYEDMNVIDYLSFIAEIHGLSATERAKALKRITADCGLDNMKHKDISELSRGYRQRVGLAQAMIHDPDILFLDEPTSGLDPNQIVEIRNLIKKIGEKKTVILSTHRLEDVSATCSRVMIINQGKIVADAPPERLQAEFTAKSRIFLTVRGPRSEVIDAVQNVDCVKTVLPLEEAVGDGVTRYEVVPDGEENPAEEIFCTIRDKGWTLNELTTEQASLEEVFRKLTIETTQEA